MRSPPPIPEATSRSTTIDGGTVRYLEAGSGDPPIVLVHGGIVDEALLSWREVIPQLASHHRILAPDLPGYGESDSPTARPVPSYYRGVLLGLLDAVGIDRAPIVGLSMGGAVALDITRTHPERVTRVVAADSYGLGGRIPGGRVSGFAIRAGLPSAIAGVLRRSDRLAAASIRVAVAPENLTRELVRDVVAAWNRPEAGRAFAHTWRAEIQDGSRRTNVIEALPELAVPIRFIHGEFDRLIPAHRSVRATTLTPESDCRILRNCGHWPPRERPDRFVELVEQFVCR